MAKHIISALASVSLDLVGDLKHVAAWKGWVNNAGVMHVNDLVPKQKLKSETCLALSEDISKYDGESLVKDEWTLQDHHPRYVVQISRWLRERQEYRQMMIEAMAHITTELLILVRTEMTFRWPLSLIARAIDGGLSSEKWQKRLGYEGCNGTTNDHSERSSHDNARFKPDLHLKASLWFDRKLVRTLCDRFDLNMSRR